MEKQPLKKETTIDLLDRQPFINQIIDIIEIISSQKKSIRFAINGNWGVGKSFVMKKIEEQLKVIQSEESLDNKYVIFHYNCWEYDYYEEPIVAIVALMLDAIEENECLISKDKKTKIKELLRTIGKGLLLSASEFVKDKTGIDPDKIVDMLNDTSDSLAEQIKENHAYDSNFIFKSTLLNLQNILSHISKDKTIIFIVDELDRCLPEYTIKVLERLHHLFEKVPNVQVVLSIDKNQLKHSVKQIYGEKTDTSKYLAKFIDFEIKLGVGNLNEKFEYEFEYYVNKFELVNDNTNVSEVKDFLRKIFSGIDMRSRIEIINKCDLLHSLLCREDKADYSVMCIELLFAVINYWNVDLEESSKAFEIDQQFIYSNETKIYTGLDYLITMYDKQQQNGNILYRKDETGFCVKRNGIWAVMLSSYRYILGFTRDNIECDSYSSFDLRNFSQKYWSLLNTIS